jgi:glycosyltransferase involved in cell wall biosynthesis
MSMTSSIRFSVIIPTYNRDNLIRETIDSVLVQDFPAKQTEIIVVDDGSTDQTQKVLASYGERIKTIYQVNKGGESARHTGVHASTGDYIVLLDNDDLLFPWALSLYDHIITVLDAPPLIMGQMKYFKDGEQVLKHAPDKDQIEVYKYNDYFSREIPVGQYCSKLVIKRSVAISKGVFRSEATAWPFDITDMLLIMGDCSPFVIVNQPLSVAYRIHAMNTISRTEYMIQSFPCLMKLEHSGSYPGGKARRFERWAIIGGMGLHWAYVGFKQKKISIAVNLLWKCSPMVVTAILRKFRQIFIPKTSSIIIGELSSNKSDSD